jgi:NitT/TauT family transport system ATP-binding protein
MGAPGLRSLRVEGVGLTWPSRRGQPVTALEDLRLRFPAGQVTAIVGPSGCGKSTLLQILRGLLRPTAGSTHFDFADGAGDRRPSMATVWQAFNLFPWMTVAENVAFGLELKGVKRAERLERARRALAAVDLVGFEGKYPRQLSGGMRQRVGLARALVLDPDILLLDEPFGALDAQTRLVLQEQLARLVEGTGKTVLLVTHSIEEAIFLGDLIVVMTARPGRVAAELPVPLARPRSFAMTRDPAFGLLFEEIYGILRVEVEKAMASEATGT